MLRLDLEMEIEDQLAARRACFWRSVLYALILLTGLPVLAGCVVVGTTIALRILDGWIVVFEAVRFDAYREPNNARYQQVPVLLALMTMAGAWFLYRITRAFPAVWVRWSTAAEAHRRAVRKLRHFNAVTRGANSPAATTATPAAPEPAPVNAPQPADLRTDIFIVHGHDETAKLSVANHLYSLGLRPIVLHEEPNLGQAIIEKFETHASTAGYAVVIMSPDDLGRPDGGTEAPRARQNVVLELGYFTGKLGRDRVFLLISGQVEMPSDILGVGHTVMDPNGAWKLDLNKELHALGYTVT